MKGLESITTILRKHKNKLFRKFQIREMAVFGSFVSGSPRADSDVDILVDFEEIPDLLEFISIKYYLEKLLHKKVDLVRKQALRKELKYVVKEGVKI